jgi:hypothetical protein
LHGPIGAGRLIMLPPWPRSRVPKTTTTGRGPLTENRVAQ